MEGCLPHPHTNAFDNETGLRVKSLLLPHYFLRGFHMCHSNAIFWAIFGVLVSASLFFGVNVENQRRQLHHSGVKLETGDVVRLVQVVDGDTVLVSKNADDSATVRIVGIKAFNAKVEKDTAALFGKAAIERLERQLSGRPVRVMLHTLPKDANGRYLATLYVNDSDVGLDLVRQGLALVYSVYPFPAMPIYLQEQELAKAKNKGFWGNSETRRRASALISGWQEQLQ